MNFLGTPQLRAGVDVLFFSKCLFLKHPSVHGGINLISFEKKSVFEERPNGEPLQHTTIF